MDADSVTVGTTVKWIAEYPNLKEYRYELCGLCTYLKTRETGKTKFTFYKPTVLKNVIIPNSAYNKSKFEELVEYLENHEYIEPVKRSFKLTSKGEALYNKIKADSFQW